MTISEVAISPPASRVPWRWLDRTLPGIAANLALDEALLLEAEDAGGPPTLRFWESPDWAVVLGASGRLKDEVFLDEVRADGVAIARRSSGGGTVVLGPGALNLAVVLPRTAAPDLETVEATQRYVLGRVAEALRGLHPAVEVLGSGDLTLGGRKFAGSAQRRLRQHVLVHATILYRFPIARVARYLRQPKRQPAYRCDRSHDDFLTNLERPRAVIVEAARAAWSAESTPEPAEIPEGRVRQLVLAKFADRAWVERF